MNFNSQFIQATRNITNEDLTNYSLEELVALFKLEEAPLPPRRGLSDKLYRIQIIRELNRSRINTISKLAKEKPLSNRFIERFYQ